MGVLVGSELLHEVGSGGGDCGSRARHGDVIVVSSGRRAGYTTRTACRRFLWVPTDPPLMAIGGGLWAARNICLGLSDNTAGINRSVLFAVYPSAMPSAEARSKVWCARHISTCAHTYLHGQTSRRSVLQ